MRTMFRFIRALLRYAIYGHFKKVEFGEYAERLNTCSKCEHINRDKWTCGICGCYLTKKAKWSTETCPTEKWNDMK